MKILASDYDGTFNKLGVSKDNIEAVKRFQKAGNLFGFITGRSLDMIIKEIDLYKIPFDFVIGCSGGFVLNKHRELEAIEYIDYPTVLEIIEMAKADKIEFIGVTDGKNYHNIKSSCNDLLNIFKTLAFKILSFKTKYILTNKKICGIYINGEQSLPLYNKICTTFPKCAAYLNKGRYIDIVATGVSKGNTLARYAQRRAISEVYCIGDSLNDLSMIEKFNGYCVDDADAEVKSIASKSFKSVDKCIDYLLKEPTYEK